MPPKSLTIPRTSEPVNCNKPLVDAIKKMDILLNDHESSVPTPTTTPTTPTSPLPKPNTLNVRGHFGESESALTTKSLDRTLNSFDSINSPNAPTSPGSRSIKFLLNSEDEDEKTLMNGGGNGRFVSGGSGGGVGEYSNVDFGFNDLGDANYDDDDDPEPNKDFVLSNIFSNKSKTTAPATIAPPKTSVPKLVPKHNSLVKPPNEHLQPSQNTHSDTRYSINYRLVLFGY